MFHIFLSHKKTEENDMINRNGDIIIHRLISGEIVEKRNDIWYMKAEFLESELLGQELTTESVVKCDAGPIKNQLFRIVYHKLKPKKHTIEIYATHIFYDAQKEVWVKDDRTVNSDWSGAISTANDIIKNSGASHPYQVYGSPWYTDYKIVEPEDGMLVKVHNLAALNNNYDRVVDIKSWNTAASAAVQIYTNTSPTNCNQVFRVKLYNSKAELLKDFPNDGGCQNADGSTFISLQSVISGRWIDKASNSDDNWTKIQQYAQQYGKSNGGAEVFGLWQRPYSTSASPTYKFTSVSNKDVNWYCGESNPLEISYQIVLIQHGYSNWANVLCWTFEDTEATATAYWVGMNLIECLFGSSDNSLISRWSECDKHHYVAMFDNYQCYFGRMDKYKDSLKPKEWIITDKQVSDYSKTISMEDVVTGIYAKGYNGRSEQNLIKADNYDDYEIHRHDIVEYQDVKYSGDDSSINPHEYPNFSDINAFYYELRWRAERDLKYTSKWQYPKTETTTKIVDFLIDEYGSDIKLNDTIYYQKGSKREKFYIEEVHYSLITGKTTDLDLVLESEVNQ